jgi:sigma-B regulation protein RsbU (phosphoserine phosphatase)
MLLELFFPLPYKLGGLYFISLLFSLFLVIFIVNKKIKDFLEASLSEYKSLSVEVTDKASLKARARWFFPRSYLLLDEVFNIFKYNKEKSGILIDKLQETVTKMEDSNRHLHREMAIARDIQLNMLMLTMPSVPIRSEVDIAAFLEPAQEIGGDLYDLFFFKEDTSFLLEENILCSYVGDVSGKGIPASLFMATTRILLKDRSGQRCNPAEILTEINQKLSKDNPHCMFVTLFLSILDLSTGELYYTNAGHNPPYLKRYDGTIEILNQRHGPAIGMIDDIVYTESKIALNYGDLLVVYTDGITEAMNSDRQLFSDLRLQSFLEQYSHTSAVEIVEAIIHAIQKFQGDEEQSDDITLLCLRFLGEHRQSSNRIEQSLRKDILENLREDWK